MNNKIKEVNKTDKVVVEIAKGEIEEMIKKEVTRQLSMISRCNSFTR